MLAADVTWARVGLRTERQTGEDFLNSPTMFPDAQTIRFLIGGAQKCGTSALAAYLAQHPDLAMSRDKETHFFNREVDADWRTPDYRPLHDQFADPEPGVLRGEATPVTIYWTPAHARIFRYNPEMRFILLFRPPIERAWSHWRMLRGRGREPLDFSSAIREGRARVLDDMGSPMGLRRHYSYVERGFYGRQLRHLTSYFPRSQMLFLNQTDLRSDPGATLGRVCDFLGIPRFGRVDPIERNASPSSHGVGIDDADADYLAEIFREDQRLFTDMTGIRFGT